jgi:hypothetical protein
MKFIYIPLYLFNFQQVFLYCVVLLIVECYIYHLQTTSIYKICYGNPTGEEITCWGHTFVCVCVWGGGGEDLTQIGEDVKWLEIRHSAW